ncbi:MAG: hypothetical protein COA38_11900 [Fluviicola sp.]|nr:MAG: hypothetical protein COA38_11900 [Fluviicola sp.]
MMKKTKWWHLMTLILLFAQNVNAQGTGCIPSNGCINTTELVTNGDFALGNLGFQSQLIPSCGQCGAGRYCVGLNELALCNSWAAVPVGPFASATNDNYMIIDASLIPNTIIWSQLVNLNNGEEYIFGLDVLPRVTGSFPPSFNILITDLNQNSTTIFTINSATDYGNGLANWNSLCTNYIHNLPNGAYRLEIQQTVTAGSGYDYGIDNVSLLASDPIIANGATFTGCPGDTITIGPQVANGSNYTYDFGNGPTNQASTTAIVGNGTQIYTVLISGCGQTVSVDLLVVPIAVPVIQIAPYTPACVGDSVVLTANSNLPVLLTWTDDQGNVVGTSSNGSSITVYPVTTTTYTVSGAVNQACEGTSQVTVTPLPGPPTIFETIDLCEGDSPVEFFFTKPGYYISGNITVNGTTQNSTNAIETFQTSQPPVIHFTFDPAVAGPGVHVVEVCYNTNFSNCCTLVTFNVCPIPVVNIAADNACDINNVLTANVGIAPNGCSQTFLWNGPGVTGETTQSVSTSQAGIYSVTVTSSVGAPCVTTATYTLSPSSVELDPIVISDETPCVGTPVDLTANATNGVAPYTYNWDLNNDGQFDNGTGATIAAAGSSYACVEVTDANGCIATICTQINYSTPPTINVTGCGTSCEGGGVLLFATINEPCDEITWQWYADQTAIPGATTNIFINDYPEGTVISVEACCNGCCTMIDTDVVITNETVLDDQQIELFNFDCTTNLLTFTLEDGGTATADLSCLNTDDQIFTDFSLNGTILTITIEDGNTVNVDLTTLQDGTGTDDQNLTNAYLNGTNLTIEIENGTSVTVDLSGLDTDTDEQNLTSAILDPSTNILTISIENGNPVSVDLSNLVVNSVGAHNGTSMSTIDPTKVSLGNDYGDTDAQLLSNREIPMNDKNIVFTDAGASVSSKNRIGIGTQNPVAKLHVELDASIDAPYPTGLYVRNYRNVTTGPSTGGRFLVTGNNYSNLGVAIDVSNGLVSTGASINATGTQSAVGINVRATNSPNSNHAVVGVALNNANSPGASNVGVIGRGYEGASNVGGDFLAFHSAPQATGSNTGVQGISANANVNYGIRGYSYGGTTNYGVYGAATGGTPTTFAGYFTSHTKIVGTLSVNSTVYTSDAKFKKDVKELKNAMDLINQLKPKTYLFDTDAYADFNFESDQQMGLIAQEVAEVIPAIVSDQVKPAEYDSLGVQISEEVSYKGVQYGELIPLLIAGMQEQQVEITQKDELIEDLNERLSKLEACLNNLLPILCEINHNIIEENDSEVQEQLRSFINVNLSDGENIVLNQNVPNPFAEKTVISYSIPETVQKAQIHFYNAQGKLINTVDISDRGKGHINVFANDLSTGIYTYSLVADGDIVATKRMVKK